MVTLGEKDHGEHRDQQDGALQQQSRAVDGQCLQHGAAAGGVKLPADDDDRDERGDQAAERKQDLSAVAGTSGQECLHQYTGHSNTEDDEYR